MNKETLKKKEGNSQKMRKETLKKKRERKKTVGNTENTENKRKETF